MGRFFSLLVLIVTLASFKGSEKTNYKTIEHSSFARGEYLEYKVNFGFFNIGEAKMIIDDKFYRINNRECYKVPDV